MSIGDVFARAFELWRRDVGWLVLAGLVVGLILVLILGVAIAVFAAIFAGAGLSFGLSAVGTDSDALGAVGVGMLVLAVIVYVIVLLLFQVVAMVFYGGMFEMVIGAARGNRGVEFGDLFSGFHKFGAYTVYALVLFGISIGTSLLNVIPLIGGIIGFVVSLWIGIIWLYVLPLIADRGLGFGDAAKRSNDMVKTVGWWRTFGMVIVLGLAIAAAALVIFLIALGVGQASDWAGIVLGLVLFLVFAVLVPPYFICYVSVMYLGSGGTEPVAAVPSAPPAPPAGTTYGTPASPTMTGESTWAAPPAPPPSAPADWRAAADPLAAAPPLAGAPAAPGAGTAAEAPPVPSGDQTAEASPVPPSEETAATRVDDQAAATEPPSDQAAVTHAGDQTAVTEAPGGPLPPAPAAPQAPPAPEPPRQEP